MSELSELELQMAESCHLGVGNQTQVLRKSKCARSFVTAETSFQPL